MAITTLGAAAEKLPKCCRATLRLRGLNKATAVTGGGGLPRPRLPSLRVKRLPRESRRSCRGRPGSACGLLGSRAAQPPLPRRPLKLRARGETLEEIQPLRPYGGKQNMPPPHTGRRSGRSRSDLPGRREGKEASSKFGPWTPRLLTGSSKSSPAPGKRCLAARKGSPAAPPKPRRAPEAPSDSPRRFRGRLNCLARTREAPEPRCRLRAGGRAEDRPERIRLWPAPQPGNEPPAAPRDDRRAWGAPGAPRPARTSEGPSRRSGTSPVRSPPPRAIFPPRPPVRSARSRRAEARQNWRAGAERRKPRPGRGGATGGQAEPPRMRRWQRAGRGMGGGGGRPGEVEGQRRPPASVPPPPSAGRAGGAALGRSLIGWEDGRDTAEAAPARPWQLLLALPDGALPAPVSRPPRAADASLQRLLLPARQSPRLRNSHSGRVGKNLEGLPPTAPPQAGGLTPAPSNDRLTFS